MIRLKNISSPGGVSKTFDPGKSIIGRSPECDFYLSDISVSRKHAEIEVIDTGRIYLADLRSRNGTRVNGRPIYSKVLLQPNDEITFGDVRFVVSSVKQSGTLAGSVTMVDTTQLLDSATVVPVVEARSLQRDNSLYNQQTFVALSALGRIPVDPDNLQESMSSSLDLLRETIRADRLALLFVEDEQVSEVSLAAASVSGINVSTEFSVSRTVIGEILKGKVAILAKEIDADKRFAERTSIAGASIRSMMSVPLVDEDKTIGILYAETNEQGITFTEDHLRVFTTFGDIMASKVLNFRLITDRQQKAVLETELRVTNSKRAELEKANRILRETQAELVQTQKMASLKHLVAGVAHEMNNPLGALQAGFGTIEQASKIITEAVTNGNIAELSDKTSKPGKALAMVLNCSGVSKQPLARIATVVKSLKNFALLDQAEIKQVDVHDGIDAALDLLSFELGDRIEVIREYGKLPSVECYAREVNQAIMNLLSNAIEAIEGEGTITISTECENDTIAVKISDTGRGILPEHIDKIFDPGFTTRGVGVGTGLGLAIVHSIIETHSGKTDVLSEIGKGSAFTLRLPVRLVRKSPESD